MSYPYGKRYIDKIREHPKECQRIGEAFDLASDEVSEISDGYYFMRDVLEELSEKE